MIIKVFDKILIMLANIIARVEEARTKTIKKGISICGDTLLDLKDQEDKVRSQMLRLTALLK